MSDRRRFSRPRTKVYDSNYNIGESYYKSALDGLDRKYGGGPSLAESEASRRPASIAGFEDLMRQEFGEGAEEPRRVQRPRPDESYDREFYSRNEEVKKRFNERMLNAVGLNGMEEDYVSSRSRRLDEEDSSLSARKRASARRTLELVEEVTASPVIHKWISVKGNAEETAARSRAHASRARLADLESEMEEAALKGAARERRLAGLRRLISDNDDFHQQISSSSTSSSMKMSSVAEKMIL